MKQQKQTEEGKSGLGEGESEVRKLAKEARERGGWPRVGAVGFRKGPCG